MRNANLIYPLFLFLGLLIFSCETEDPTPDDNNEDPQTGGLVTISSYLENTAEYSDFFKLLNEDTEINSLLVNSEGNLTLFVISNTDLNASMELLGIDSLNQFYDQIKRDIVRFHINTTSSISSSDFNANTVLSTLVGENVEFNAAGQINNGGLSETNSIIGDEVIVDNGIIHQIDGIIIPPSIFMNFSEVIGSNYFPIEFVKDFSDFKEILEANSGLVSESINLLKDSSVGTTLFLPINGTYTKSDYLSLNRNTFKVIIENHISSQTPEIASINTIELKSTINYSFDSNGDIFAPIGDLATTINTFDAFGSNNGRIHTLNGILEATATVISDLSIYEYIAQNSSLVTYIDQMPELKAYLTGLSDNSITFFLPNESAVEKLELTIGFPLEELRLDLLEDILRFHIVESIKSRSDFMESSSIKTLQGEDIAINANGNISTGGSDADVQFVSVEKKLNQGVVHEVETILIPPTIFGSIGTSISKVSFPIYSRKEFEHF